MTVLQVILLVVVLVALPALGGIGICRLLKIKASPAKCLLAGIIAFWAISQVLIVPMVLSRASFTAASNALLLILIALAALGAFMLLWGWRKNAGDEAEEPAETVSKPEEPKKEKKEDPQGIVVMSPLEEMALRDLVREGMEEINGTEKSSGPAKEHVPFTAFSFQSTSPEKQSEEPAETAKPQKQVLPDKCRLSSYLALVLMALIIGVVIYQSVVLRNADADDSRFVVNAVEMVRTDRMYLTNPATGKEISRFKGELAKDVVAPWAVFPASASRWVGVSPTVFMHSVVPILMVILVSLAYYLLSRKFFPKGWGGRCFFVFLLWLINIYGYYSIYGPETFIMIRSWQGKAVVASFAIPMMIYIFFCIYEEPKNWGRYISLLAVNLCMCFLSSMGLVIGAVMIGCYAIVYAIAKRNLLILPKMLLLCIPNAVYYYLYTLVVARKI